MGNYVTASDIEGELKGQTLTSGAVVSSAKISEWITQEEARIDGTIAGVYSVPVTGTVSLAIMKGIAIKAVKARLYDFLQMKSTSPKGDVSFPAERLQAEVYGDGQSNPGELGLIRTRKLLLRDATLAESSAGVRGETEENSSIVPAQVQIGVTQW